MKQTRDQRLEQIHGRKALKRLRSSVAASIGVGVLGGPTTFVLGQLGVKQVLIDDGLVEPPNLGNQQFPAHSVGKPKVEVRAAQIRELNPDAVVETIQARVEDVGHGVFEVVSLLCGAPDNRIARLHTAQLSQRLEIPWVDAAVDGSGRHLQGTVTLWAPGAPEAPCYGCRYTSQQLQRVRTEGRRGCPSILDPGVPVTPPTLMGAAFGLCVAGLAGVWAIEALLDRAEELENTQVRLFADGPVRTETVKLSRSKHCPLPHQPLAPLHVVPAGTVDELWRDAAPFLRGEPESLLLHGRTLISQLTCATCGRSDPLPRIAGVFRDQERCGCHSGAVRVGKRFTARIERDDVPSFRGARWSEIGLPAGDIVTAQRGGEQAHFIVGRPARLSALGGSNT